MRRSLIGLVPALAALVALPAMAALVAEVRDDAGFFKPEAIAKANLIVKSIKNQYKHDLLIETYKTVPADQADEFKKLDKEGRSRFYSDWALRRARATEVNGVYVLINKEPGHIEIAVGNETKKKAFTVANRDHLDELLLARFRKAAGLKDDSEEKQKIYDQALLDAVNYVQDTFKANLGRASVDPAPGQVAHPINVAEPHPNRINERHTDNSWGIGGYLCIGLVALLAIWVVVGLVRSFSGGGGGMGGGGYGGVGGGGFFSSLIGGMFGAAAGMWLYDSFFRGGFGGGGWGGSSAYGANPDSGSSPQDTDYSAGGGGDVDGGGGGDTGGGGDFGGGGDTGGGGGDFGGGGGGDFGGGGGGDFGGGGGDF